MGVFVLSNGSFMTPFHQLPLASRQQMLVSFASSWIGEKRKTFKILKTLIILKVVSSTKSPSSASRSNVLPSSKNGASEAGAGAVVTNPNWQVMGYNDLPANIAQVERLRSELGRNDFVFDMMNKLITKDVELETDVVIVGSGCGGSVMAATLSKSNQVILLEKGPYLQVRWRCSSTL
jgi:hypothetical protein